MRSPRPRRPLTRPLLDRSGQARIDPVPPAARRGTRIRAAVASRARKMWRAARGRPGCAARAQPALSTASKAAQRQPARSSFGMPSRSRSAVPTSSETRRPRTFAPYRTPTASRGPAGQGMVSSGSVPQIDARDRRCLWRRRPAQAVGDPSPPNTSGRSASTAQITAAFKCCPRASGMTRGPCR